MNYIQQRFVRFLGLCIPTRFGISYLAKTQKNEYVINFLAIICLIMGLGFLKIYFFGSETADNQLEWAEGKVWWNNLRILHGFLYVLFAVLVFLKKDNAWMIIFLDTIIGLISFFNYHISNKNIQKLL